MTSDRKKPGVAFWATVMMVVGLVGYPLSIGPAFWITSRTGFGGDAVSVLYQPLLLLSWDDLNGPRRPLRSYLFLMAAYDWCISRGPDGFQWRRCDIGEP